jgi:hypothetical protein
MGRAGNTGAPVSCPRYPKIFFASLRDAGHDGRALLARLRHGEAAISSA